MKNNEITETAELPMVETKPTFTDMTNVVLDVVDIYAVQDAKTGEVEKIIFQTKTGYKVSYAPSYKYTDSQNVSGLAIKREMRGKYTPQTLPDKIKKLNNLFIRQQRQLRLLCDYTEWVRLDKGEALKGGFMSYHEFDCCYPVDDNNKEIPLL